MISTDDQNDSGSLERRLQARRVAMAMPELRERIMLAAARELEAQARSKTTSVRHRPAPTGGVFMAAADAKSRRLSFPAFIAATAATLLVGLNLSLSAASSMPSENRPRVTVQQTLDDAALIRSFSSNLTSLDARRIAVLLRAGDSLKSLPRVASPQPLPE